MANFTWTVDAINSNSGGIVSLCDCGNDIILAGTGYNGNIWRKTSIGGSWELVLNVAGINSINAITHLGGGVVLAASGSGSGDADIYKSVNYGETFSKIELNLPANIRSVESILSLGDGNAILTTSGLPGGNYGYIYKTNNYGTSWSFKAAASSSNGLFCSVDMGGGILIAGSYGSNIIYISEDSGESWTDYTTNSIGLPDNCFVVSLCKIANNTLLAGIQYELESKAEIYKSSNNGLTFQLVFSDTLIQGVYSIINLGDYGILAGTGNQSGAGTVLFSEDDGETWVDKKFNDSLYNIKSLVYYGEGIVASAAVSISDTLNVYYGKIVPEITLVNPSSNITAGNTLTITGTGIPDYSNFNVFINDINCNGNILSKTTTQMTMAAPAFSYGDYNLYLNVFSYESNSYNSNSYLISYPQTVETVMVRELIEEAFLVLGVKPINGSLPDAEMQNARKTLNRLIESWNIVRANTAYNKQESFYLVANQQEYTIGAGGNFNTDRPVRILAASIRDGGVDYDLDLIGYNDWMQIHNKGNTSNIPKCLYYEPAFSLGKIFLYYKPSSASATLRIMTENQLGSFATLDSAVSVPPGYQRALIYNLALDLLPKYPTEAMRDMIMKIASESLADVRRLNLHNNVHRQLETNTRISRKDVWNGY